MPNSYIYQYEGKEFDRASFNMERKGKNAEFTPQTIEGRKYIIGYLLKEGTRPVPSRLQILRNYLNAARRAGGTKHEYWTNADDGGMLGLEEITLKFGKTSGEIWIRLAFDNAYLDPDVA